MGDLIVGDDGDIAEAVGEWAKDKHDYLCRYIDISRAVRRKWLGPNKGGATYIDPFCGPGRCQIRETGEWIDGGAVAAWKKSQEGGAPFSQIYIADLDPDRRKAMARRLVALGAPVLEIEGAAVDAIALIVKRVSKFSLNFAFLDPYTLAALDFSMVRALSTLKYVDMLIHVSQMDLQRNLIKMVESDDERLEAFAPGWRSAVDLRGTQLSIRKQIFDHWKSVVSDLGVETSSNWRLLRAGKNQPLYWLLLVARHQLADKFWTEAIDGGAQGSMF